MPTAPALPLVTPEYLKEYRGDTLLAICVTFIIFETVFVVLRCYARYLTTSSFGWDDAIIPAAWLANIGLAILCITAVYDAGVGRHLAAVLKYHPGELRSWAKSLYALEWLYLTAVALPKMSILLLYLRILTNRGARLACHVLLVLLAAIWLSFIIASSVQCLPLAYQWDKTIPGGHCFDVGVFYKASSAPNIVTDIIIVVLPMPTIYRLQTTGLRKFGLFFVFLVGSVGLIGSCLRMAAFFRHDAFTDNTWSSVLLMGWSVIEPGMYLIAACLLAFRPVLRKFSPKEIGSRLRHTRLFLKTDESIHDKRLGCRREAYLSRSSISGFVELQDANYRHDEERDSHSPPNLSNADPSQIKQQE